MTYYVYELIDPRSGSVFYVGKGKGNRIDAHEAEARKGIQSRKCRLIREIEAAGLAIGKRKVAEFQDEQAAYDYEADLVDEYGLDALTNVIPGGGTAWTRYIRSVKAKTPPCPDRMQIRHTSWLLQWTEGGKLSQIVWGNSEPVDLSGLIKSQVDAIPAIIDRKGAEWVNAISRRWNVEFEYA